MLPRSFLLAVLPFQIYHNAHGYMIDQDCGADTDFVEARINAAFTLIDHAYTELNKAAINPDVDDWHNMMFGRNYAATASELRRNMKNRFNGLLLIRDKTDHDTTIPGVRTDVRFYCTLQRITKNKIGEYVNKDTGYTFKKGEMSNRFANCYDGLSAAMMSTFTLTGNMSQVQICPWYLRTVIEGKHRDLASLPAMIFSGVSKIYMPVKMKLSWTPIDAFRMMDNTIIHELTHTDQVEQATADQKKSFREGAYGFNNAKKKADRYRDGDQKLDPMQNADNNSLFAVGVWIITKGGGRIGQDGSFNAAQVSAAKRLVRTPQATFQSRSRS